MTAKTRFNWKTIDYRHYICTAITLVFVACWLLFPHALRRIIESVRDFFTSILYDVCELLDIEHNISATVNDLPKFPFFSNSTASAPTTELPNKWEAFQADWTKYWMAWANAENFLLYLLYVAYYTVLFIQVAMILFIALFVLRKSLERYLSTHNNKADEDSKAVSILKWIVFRLYLPIKTWVLQFILFTRKNAFWWKIWVVLWAFYFNVFTITIEFFAYYFYLVGSLDFVGLYVQVYKLFLDLAVPFNFIPLWVWVIVGFILFDLWRKSLGYDKVHNYEYRNRGFWNARPIVSMIYATMGMGKTTMEADGGLSTVCMFRDKAFEKILENDLKFPRFPWINLENTMKRAMAAHTVYNLATIRRFIRRRRKYFEAHPTRRNCFNYDFEHYGLTYNDKLKISNVWDVIETYAQLYFIYIMMSAISNFSLRTDEILSDRGNFPLWDSDFFFRDSRLAEAYSRHAKILDFDSVRLGFKLLQNNKYADSFEFGVVLITEIGKERGNKVENADKKKESLKTNQKNDGFNSWLKMIRHSATVDGYPFVKVITDEQRPESWGADARDLCEIVHIREKGETRLAMPFFFLEELLYQFVFNKFAEIYYRYRHSRSDNTLPMWLLKGFVAGLEHYYNGIYNTFGYHVLDVEVERGTQDGETKKASYYIVYKKIYAKRFSTDCFSDYFTQKALRSTVGIGDLPEYATEKATFEELGMQNSYFINDLIDGMNSDE